nr:MAG TPA: hypothetical protein [Caudoviricetes sp.]
MASKLNVRLFFISYRTGFKARCLSFYLIKNRLYRWLLTVKMFVF